MLDVIKEAATRLVQELLSPELKEEVTYLLDNCKDSYDTAEMNVLIGKLLSNIEENIATFGGSIGTDGPLQQRAEETESNGDIANVR